MWAALRRGLNRSFDRGLNRLTDAPALATGPAAATGHVPSQVPRQPGRTSYDNQRRPVDLLAGRVNRGPFVGIYRAPGAGPAATANPAAAPPDAAATATTTPNAARAGSSRLRSWHIRNRRFPMRWWGLDPAEVRGFLDRVADELTAVHAELATSREETQRVKDALRQWQTRQAPSAYDLAAADHGPGRR